MFVTESGYRARSAALVLFQISLDQSKWTLSSVMYDISYELSEELSSSNG
jgi:hypothetical protein